MEAGALNPGAGVIPGIAGRSPLLRLQSDERLIALIRRGQHGAFEVLVQRYQTRLLSFCRHMLGSTEDAEDVLQEVFAAAYNAILGDERAINARPWLYRIARNRCLNHLRRPVPNGQDSMDVFERDGGQTTADAVHKREEFRQIVADVQELPETQRTALLLREIDALSYEHIAEAMDTTVPSVKSLLVRARVSLAEAAEARLLTCEEVRVELAEVSEGIAKTTAPARRHLKGCERCRTFKRELRRQNKALAAVYPIGPLIIFKKLLVGKLGIGATTSGSGAAGGAGIAGGAAATGASGAGGVISAGVGAIATKAVAGMAAAAIVTAGAVDLHQHSSPHPHSTAASSAGAAPVVVSSSPQARLASSSSHTAAKAATATTQPASLKTPASPADAAKAKQHKGKNLHKPGDRTAAQSSTTTTPAATAPQPATQPTQSTQPAVVTQPVITQPTGTDRGGSTVTLGPGGTTTSSSTTSSQTSQSDSTGGSASGPGSSGSGSPPPSSPSGP